MKFLHTLRQKNKDRQKLWDPENKLSGPVGKLYRSNEMGGELGEAVTNKFNKTSDAVGFDVKI